MLWKALLVAGLLFTTAPCIRAFSQADPPQSLPWPSVSEAKALPAAEASSSKRRVCHCAACNQKNATNVSTTSSDTFRIDGVGDVATPMVIKLGEVPISRGPQTRDRLTRVPQRVPRLCELCQNQVPLAEASVDPSRAELAKQLLEHVTADDCDPQHIEQMISLAFDIVSDNAESAAEARYARLLATRREKYQVEHPVVTDATTPTLPNQITVLSHETAQLRKLLVQTRDQVQELSQQVASLHYASRLHGEATASSSRADLRHPTTSRITDPDQRTQLATLVPEPLPSNTPFAGPSEGLVIRRLQQRIAGLERELHLQRTSAPEFVQEQTRLSPLNDEIDPLLPRDESEMQLTPKLGVDPDVPLSRDDEQIVVSYFVGDLAHPPYFDSILDLAQFVRTQVARESWGHQENEILVNMDSALVIRQTQQNHLAITRLLNGLRPAAARNPAFFKR